MKITMLGCGTSVGIPALGRAGWGTCDPQNPKNRRQRCAILIQTKSTTILNYCDIGPNIIDYICDTTKEKIGKFSPGMHIPIVSVENFRKDDAEIVYLFAWNHKDEILKKESVFTEKKREWISHVKI